jgi:hypothetical protein
MEYVIIVVIFPELNPPDSGLEIRSGPGSNGELE